MNDTDSFGCGVGSDRGEQRSDTGTDVLPHDDRYGQSDGNRTGQSQRLQNTDRCGRRLDNGCDDGSEQKSEQRILEFYKNFTCIELKISFHFY